MHRILFLTYCIWLSSFSVGNAQTQRENAEKLCKAIIKGEYQKFVSILKDDFGHFQITNKKDSVQITSNIRFFERLFNDHSREIKEKFKGEAELIDFVTVMYFNKLEKLYIYVGDKKNILRYDFFFEVKEYGRVIGTTQTKSWEYPSFYIFWDMVGLAIINLLIRLWTVWAVLRSELRNKIWWVLVAFSVNLVSIVYSPLEGFMFPNPSLDLLGVNFYYNHDHAIIGSYCAIQIPIGVLIVLRILYLKGTK